MLIDGRVTKILTGLGQCYCQIDRLDNTTRLWNPIPERTHPFKDPADANPLRALADTPVEHVVQRDLFMVPGCLRHLCLLLLLHIRFVVQPWVHRGGLLWLLHVSSAQGTVVFTWV